MNAEQAKKNTEKFNKNKQAFIQKTTKKVNKECLDNILKQIKKDSKNGKNTLDVHIVSKCFGKYNTKIEPDKEYIISELQKRKFKVEMILSEEYKVSF